MENVFNWKGGRRDYDTFLTPVNNEKAKKVTRWKRWRMQVAVGDKVPGDLKVIGNSLNIIRDLTAWVAPEVDGMCACFRLVCNRIKRAAFKHRKFRLARVIELVVMPFEMDSRPALFYGENGGRRGRIGRKSPKRTLWIIDQTSKKGSYKVPTQAFT